LEVKTLSFNLITKKVYRPQNSYFIENESLKLNIEESILFLKKEEYQVEHYN
ncbi:2334_t:CDS:1, partial [Scutellospora calospora]